ncbi:MAG: methyltransferase [Propionibacteriaceae bacterium]|nr:methyltransferase [Propionibacteriaceae bacterium]
MDPVDRLILDEAPEPAGRVLVLDAPDLAAAVADRGWPVVAYADSLLLENHVTVPVIDRLPGQVVGSPMSQPPMSGADNAPAVSTELADVDLVVLRLPKSVAALEEYAQRLAWLPRGVHVVAGGRVKHMTRSMNEALATRFGDVRASLGRQKSRVLHAAEPTPGPIDYPRTAHHAELDLSLAAHGATFAGTRVDPGTRLLLTVLDQIAVPGQPTGDGRPVSGTAGRTDPGTTIDLGSGNGTLSALLARAGHQVLAIDESRAACQATAATAALNGVSVSVERADGLAEQPTASSGLIVCNPPFHVGTTKDSGPALAMIADAGRVLRPGGELWLVFNAHLPYLQSLRRIGQTEIVARNPKFIVTRTVRSDGNSAKPAPQSPERDHD